MHTQGLGCALSRPSCGTPWPYRGPPLGCIAHVPGHVAARTHMRCRRAVSRAVPRAVSRPSVTIQRLYRHPSPCRAPFRMPSAPHHGASCVVSQSCRSRIAGCVVTHPNGQAARVRCRPYRVCAQPCHRPCPYRGRGLAVSWPLQLRPAALRPWPITIQNIVSLLKSGKMGSSPSSLFYCPFFFFFF